MTCLSSRFSDQSFTSVCASAPISTGLSDRDRGETLPWNTRVNEIFQMLFTVSILRPSLTRTTGDRNGPLGFRQPNRQSARDSRRNHESHPGGSIAPPVTRGARTPASGLRSRRRGAGTLTGAKPLGPAPPPVNWGPRYATPGPRRRVGSSPALCDLGGLRRRLQFVHPQGRHVYAAIRGRLRPARRQRKARREGPASARDRDRIRTQTADGWQRPALFWRGSRRRPKPISLARNSKAALCAASLTFASVWRDASAPVWASAAAN
jgi:hypothetical protein